VARRAIDDDGARPLPPQSADLAPTQTAFHDHPPQAQESREPYHPALGADEDWMEQAMEQAEGDDHTVDAIRPTEPVEAGVPRPSAAPVPIVDRPKAVVHKLPAPVAVDQPKVRSAAPEAVLPALRLPPLRALAQLAQTYLLTEGPDGALYLIDQHAAHERITYERLLAQHAAGVLPSQTLLMPQHVALPPSAQHTLLEAADELEAWSFVLVEAEGDWGNPPYIEQLRRRTALLIMQPERPIDRRLWQLPYGTLSLTAVVN
jgi:DNA mismatch repair ATPase MutL